VAKDNETLIGFFRFQSSFFFNEDALAFFSLLQPFSFFSYVEMIDASLFPPEQIPPSFPL